VDRTEFSTQPATNWCLKVTTQQLVCTESIA
jgi:hypothetical protein